MGIFARLWSENRLKRLFGYFFLFKSLAFHKLFPNIVQAVLVWIFSLDLVHQHLRVLHIGYSHWDSETLLVSPAGRLFFSKLVIHHGLSVKRFKVDLDLTNGIWDPSYVIFRWANTHKSWLLLFIASSWPEIVLLWGSLVTLQRSFERPYLNLCVLILFRQ